MGEDVGLYGGHLEVTGGLLDRFGGERVIDTPISEAIIGGAAVGAAIGGMRPVAEIQHIDFIPLALDAIVNHGAVLPYAYDGQITVPVVIRTQGGSFPVGTQHSKSLEAWLVHIPGLKVVMPSTPGDAKGLLKAAIRDPNPVVFVEHKLIYRLTGEVPDGEYLIEIGKAEVKREGRDVTVVATSKMVHETLEAAEALSDQGIDVEVIDPRTLMPLDTETIFRSVEKTGRLVIVHEAWTTGGYGAEIAARVSESAFHYLKGPILRLGAADVPIPYSPPLEEAARPTAAKILSGIQNLLGSNVSATEPEG
jgi:pyruvate dehydrogenase E1 component beta subunit